MVGYGNAPTFLSCSPVSPVDPKYFSAIEAMALMESLTAPETAVCSSRVCGKRLWPMKSLLLLLTKGRGLPDFLFVTLPLSRVLSRSLSRSLSSSEPDVVSRSLPLGVLTSSRSLLSEWSLSLAAHLGSEDASIWSLVTLDGSRGDSLSSALIRSRSPGHCCSDGIKGLLPGCSKPDGPFTGDVLGMSGGRWYSPEGKRPGKLKGKLGAVGNVRLL